MDNTNDEQKTSVLRKHFDNEIKEIIIDESTNKWQYSNLIDASNRELLFEAKKYDLIDDLQTKNFCEFISAASSFSSSDFKIQISKIPNVVNVTKELIDNILKEIKEFSSIALEFREIINCFVKLVMETQKNMGKILPLLENANTFLEMYVDALKPSKQTEIDHKDIDTSLDNLVYGVESMKKIVNVFESKSVDVDNQIKSLKHTVVGKIQIVNNRLIFQNLLSPAGAVIGGAIGVGAAQLAVESTVFGGIGALVVGGIAFPPMGAILLAAVIGGLSVGSIFFLVKRLWESHQFKALGFLKEILKRIEELNRANTEFIKLMNQSSSHAHRLDINIEQLKRISHKPTERIKNANIAICERSIHSIKSIIQTINEINSFSFGCWYNREEIIFGDTPPLNDGNNLLAVKSEETTINTEKHSKIGKIKNYFKKKP